MKLKTHTLPGPISGPNPLSKPKKILTRFNSSPLPLCFRPSTTTPSLQYPHAPPSTTTTTTTTSTPYLSTCLYQTNLGIFSLTWSHTLFSRSFHLTLHPPHQPPSPSLSSTSSSPPPFSLSSPSFHLTLKKPFLFWNKHGSKKLSPSLSIYWDLSQARFGPGPEPTSGFYIALIHQGEITLLIGDLQKEAIAKTKAKNFTTIKSKVIIRREHIFGSRLFSTTTVFGARSRNILIELDNNSSKSGCTDDPRLVIRVDNKRVLQVKHLKWKFRGSERVEVDGTHIQLSWDVYNFLFDEENSGTHNEDGYALFTFRFEEEEDEGMNEEEEQGQNGKFGGVIWSTTTQDSCGLNYERKKMKKKMLTRTSVGGSSSSISSVSSGSSSSVLEWESVEENELKGPTGFSLLLYAWKKC